MLWFMGAVALIFLVLGGALQFAIWRNGPAVLSAVDRIAGGDRGAQLKVSAATGDHPSQKVVVWGPEDSSSNDPRPVLLFVHGGSWRSGDPDDYGFVARAFVPEGFVVVLAGYRLHPDAVYPAMLEDTAAAVRWTREEIAAHGGDPEQIVLAGHSAGAYNVVMASLEERWLGAHAIETSEISAVIGLAGPYDFVPFDSESTIASFGHVADPHTTQPLTHIEGEAPPMLLIHGEKDSLVRIRNSRILAEELGKFDGQAETLFYPEMEHNDPLISLAAPWRSRRDLVAEIAAFARDASERASGNPDEALQTSVPVQDDMR